MFTTIQRLIDGQTKEIAVLKALGFSNQAISLHYILFGLVVSLLGSFAGFAISPLMSWFVLETQSQCLHFQIGKYLIRLHQWLSVL